MLTIPVFESRSQEALEFEFHSDFEICLNHTSSGIKSWNNNEKFYVPAKMAQSARTLVDKVDSYQDHMIEGENWLPQIVL